MSASEVVPDGVVTVNDLDVSFAYSGKKIGNVDPRFGEPEDVQASRATLLAALNPTHYVVQVPQGGNEFVELSSLEDDELEEEYVTDGLFIDRPGIALGLNTADCVPMVLYAKNNPVLGVIHAGRPGVDGGIHEAAIQHMTGYHDVEPGDIFVYFGPAIRQSSYFYPEISPEQLDNPKWSKFIDRKNGNYHIDLVGRVVSDLVELDVRPHHIQISGVNVGASLDYFSHTRSNHTGEPEGRNGFAAMLQAD